MTRRDRPTIARLSAWTLGATVLLVAIGGFTRGSGSGYGCADRWPLCENGLLGGLLPRPEFHMAVEWTHRWFAAIAVVLVALVAVVAWWRHRDHRALTWTATGALGAILLQAGIGAFVVMSGLQADLVSVHLGVAMLLLGLLAYVVVASHYLDGRRPVASAAPDRTWRLLAGAGAAGVYVVIVLGSLVHDRFVGPAAFPDGWPLVLGDVFPTTDSATVQVHYAHRVAVAVGVVYLAYLAASAVRRRRPRAEVTLVHAAFALFVVNVGIGVAHVFTMVSSSGLVVAHLLVASLAWTALVAATVLARHSDRAAPVSGQPRAAPAARVGT